VGIRKGVEGYRDMFLDKIAERREEMPEKWELVLDMREDPQEGRVCHYYFIDSFNRTMFWFHDCDVSSLLGYPPVYTDERIRESNLPVRVIVQMIGSL
jgi:hypothetical protein